MRLEGANPSRYKACGARMKFLPPAEWENKIPLHESQKDT